MGLVEAFRRRPAGGDGGDVGVSHERIGPIGRIGPIWAYGIV
jgi:hypothetical protein